MLYEYKCDGCAHQFTKVLPLDDRNIPLEEPCPKCEHFTVYRVYSVAGTIDGELLKADKRMEHSGVQAALERIRDNVNKDMKWTG